jgi:ubiquinone/menaquinone biosynthesis C-methylase UbiE
MDPIFEKNRQIYNDFYRKFMQTKGKNSFVKIYHRRLEKNLEAKHFNLTLELGAGKGEHFPFVQHSYEVYIQSDVLHEGDPVAEVVNGKVIRYEWTNAENLSAYGDASVDRIVTTCLLLHLEDLPKALREWKRVVKPGGQIDLLIMCEPGALLRFAQKISSRRIFKKLNLNYDLWQYSEHRSYYLRARVLIAEIFSDYEVEDRFFPFPRISWDFNLWNCIRITSRV